MKRPEIQLLRNIKIGRHIRLLILLSASPPISKIPQEPIPLALIQILIIPVLPSRLAPHSRDMHRATRPQAVNARPRPPPIIPRAAPVRQHRPREEGVRVLDKVVGRLLLRHNRLDPLASDFPQHPRVVGDLRLHALRDRAARPVAVRAVDEEKIRKARRRGAQVRVREAVLAVGRPDVRKLFAGGVDRERRDHVAVRAGGAEHRVDLAVFSVYSLDPGGSEALDTLPDEVDVVLLESF